VGEWEVEGAIPSNKKQQAAGKCPAVIAYPISLVEINE
jgi:hypothetical protein